MEDELKQLGLAVRAHREHGGGLRLPRSLRAEVTDVAQQARNGGMPLTAIASMTSLSTQSIQRWTQAKAAAGPGLVPVRVRPAAGLGNTSLTVTSPDGWRVGGLDVEGAASLLRAVR